MSVIPIAEVKTWCGITGSDNYIVPIHDAVEAYLTALLGMNLEETSYYRERYNGNGSRCLTLFNHPVTELTRLSVGFRAVIEVSNNTSDATQALVRVTVDSTTGIPEKIQVKLIGGASAHDWQDIILASNDLEAIETLINAKSGAGWSAIVSDDYNDIPGIDLIPTTSFECLNTTAYLGAPEVGVSEYDLGDLGNIYLRSHVLTPGVNNIIVDYKAGYTADTLPKDLKLAILMMCEDLYVERKGQYRGLSEFKAGDIAKKFSEIIPDYLDRVITRYRRETV